MSSAYGNIIQRIEKSSSGDKELGMRILSWIFRALRPLSMDGLLEALVVEKLEPNETLEDVLQDMLISSDVIECYESSVTYEKSSGFMRFTHFIVQEFIRKQAQE